MAKRKQVDVKMSDTLAEAIDLHIEKNGYDTYAEFFRQAAILKCAPELRELGALDRELDTK